MPAPILAAILAAGLSPLSSAIALPPGTPLPGALVPGPGAVDDKVPAAIEALLAQPTAPFAFGEPGAALSDVVFSRSVGRDAWSMADVGDVTGDDAADLAIGYGPSRAHRGPNVEVRDGRTGQRVWAARSGRGLRSLHALGNRDGRLVIAPESNGGAVDCRDSTDGTLLWRTLLAPGALVTLHDVLWVDDLTGDGVPDVIVAGGRGLDAVVMLSGANGDLEWIFPAGDVTYDLAPWRDADGDTKPDFVSVGGDDSPFLRIQSSAHGEIIFEESVPSTGSIVTPIDDISDDGVDDLLVGMFNQPGLCLVARNGADLSPLWEGPFLDSNVTSIDTVHDIDASGARDVVVGSFDNAIVGVRVRDGIQAWRREVGKINGGHMLSVATLGDLDGDGTLDVCASSFDGQAYVLGGDLGQFMAITPLRTRQLVTQPLGDGNDDGRKEWAIGGAGSLTVLDGAGGLAGGPQLVIEALGGGEFLLEFFAFPGTGLFMLISARPADIPIPGFTGSLGLDPATLVIVLQGTAPGAGTGGFLVGPFPYTGAQYEIFAQVASVYTPDFGMFSNVAAFSVTR